jgi:FkbM family methyltransferase
MSDLVAAARRIARPLKKLVGTVFGTRPMDVRLHRPCATVPQLTLGTSYGSHTIAREGIESNSIVYSFGIGEDASFDLELIAIFGCDVYAFDPTPKSVTWVTSNVSEPRFHFEAIGVGTQDGNVIAKKPDNPNFVSHSKIPSGVTVAPSDCVDFRVERFSTIRKRKGHVGVDILKLDIEGFEYEVLADLLREGERPGQIAVEFHHGMYDLTPADTQRSVEALTTAGYVLFHVAESGREYSFIQRQLIGNT